MNKEICIPNVADEQLVGTLHGTLGKTLTIVCHGLADNQKNPLFISLCDTLVENKLSAFRFDFSGNGKSEGAFSAATFHKEQADLQSVMDYFSAQGVKSFVLIGHSMGGGVIKLIAAANPDTVKAIVCLAGVSKPGRFKEKYPEMLKQIQETGTAYFMQQKFGKRFPLTQAYVDSAFSIDIMGTAAKIHCPVLCIQGDKDTPGRDKETREWLEQCAAPSQFIILKDVDHFFNRFHSEDVAQKTREQVTQMVVDWVCKDQ